MKARRSDDESLDSIRLRLDKCATQFDLFRLLREITEFYGFDSFFVAGSGEDGARTLSDMIIISSAQSNLIQRYDDLGLFDKSPLRRALAGTGVPFHCRLDVDFQGCTPEQLQALKAFREDFNIDSCFVTPVYHRDFGPGTVCFLGKKEPMCFADIADLALVSQLAHQKLRSVSAQPAVVDSPLTERERECLVWTSSGKTSVEIARILTLSEHTVNHYLNNAARKLNAVNRTQAVAFAIRQGFID
ncbi:LuxR C-terminal-related transcriptional regulator [Hoeflea sp.]|uniref:helix-turn-helix transcriptional regulator n=1 Tax=Hoeflea sp. TaxID=1940281 RepID=UPI003B529E09